MGDKRALLKDGREDMALVVGGHRYPVHRNVMIERCPSIATVIDENADAYVTSQTMPESDVKELISFIYADAVHCADWDTTDWNSLMMASLSLNIPELTEQLVHWREHPPAKSTEATHVPGEEDKVIVGWKTEDTLSNALSLSFEVEGNGYAILRFYRPEWIGECEWCAMTMKEKVAQVNGNWAKLKRRVETTCFYWMPQFLVIEDSGFLWEVNFSGDTPGFCAGVNTLFDDLYNAVDEGLVLGDREMDSGVQMHIAFPLCDEGGGDESIRRHLVSLLVHSDDYLFLRDFKSAILDDCNNLWLREDVQALSEAMSKGREALDELVSKNGMPNPAVKHKHIGFRGKDTYKVSGRYGFELRRCGSIEQQETLMRYLVELLGNFSSDSSLRLSKSPYRKHNTKEYSIQAVTEFVHGEARRIEQSFSESKIQLGQLDAVIERWVARAIEWEYHLINCKLKLWGKAPLTELADHEIEEKLQNKLRRRVQFVLESDWARFPNQYQSQTLAMLCEEQSLLIERINSGLSLRERQGLAHNDVLLVADSVHLEEVRGHLIDFACRLAQLY